MGWCPKPLRPWAKPLQKQLLDTLSDKISHFAYFILRRILTTICIRLITPSLMI